MSELWWRFTNWAFGWDWVWLHSHHYTFARRIRLRPADGRPYIMFFDNVVFLDNTSAARAPRILKISPITFPEDQLPPQKGTNEQ